MLLQSTIYLVAWGTTHFLVSHHGPSTRIAPAITKLNSRIYSIVSFLLFLMIVSPDSAHTDLGRYLFHLSKFWEYIDIIGVCAAGGTVCSVSCFSASCPRVSLFNLRPFLLHRFSFRRFFSRQGQYPVNDAAAWDWVVVYSELESWHHTKPSLAGLNSVHDGFWDLYPRSLSFFFSMSRYRLMQGLTQED